MQNLKDAVFVIARKAGSCIYYVPDADSDALEKLKILVNHIETLIKSEKHDELYKNLSAAEKQH